MGRKEEYRSLIQASPLFELERDSDAYRVEELKMIADLYNYMTAFNHDYENYGLEITEVAKECINYYDPQKKDFLSYFISSLTRKRNTVAATEDYSRKTGGMVHTEHATRRLIEYKRFQRNFEQFQRGYEQLKRLAAKRGTSVSLDLIKELAANCEITEQTAWKIVEMEENQFDPYDELIEAAAVQFGCTVKKARETAEIAEAKVLSATVYDDENERSILDSIADDGKNPEEILLEEESNISIRRILSQLDNFYNTLQERQKPLLSVVITFKLLDSEDATEWIDLLDSGEYDFANRACIDFYRREKRILSQKEIAAKFDKIEASVSRTVNDFLRKLKEELRKPHQ